MFLLFTPDLKEVTNKIFCLCIRNLILTQIHFGSMKSFSKKPVDICLDIEIET